MRGPYSNTRYGTQNTFSANWFMVFFSLETLAATKQVGSDNGRLQSSHYWIHSLTVSHFVDGPYHIFIWLTKLLWFFHWKAVILRKFSKWILFLRVHPNRLKGQQWKNSPSLKRAENAARRIKFSHVQQIKNFNLSVQINWFKRILMIHAEFECSKFYFNWFDKNGMKFWHFLWKDADVFKTFLRQCTLNHFFSHAYTFSIDWNFTTASGIRQEFCIFKTNM